MINLLLVFFRDDDVTSTIDHFTSIVMKCSDVAIITRCHKILTLASLPRSVFELLQNSSWEPSPSDCSMLFTVGKIMSCCMAPLCGKLLSCKVQETEGNCRFMEEFVEYYVRALTAFVRIPTLMTTETNDNKLPSLMLAKVHAESDAAAANLVNFLDQEHRVFVAAPVECVEKAAKVSMSEMEWQSIQCWHSTSHK